MKVVLKLFFKKKLVLIFVTKSKLESLLELQK